MGAEEVVSQRIPRTSEWLLAICLGLLLLCWQWTGLLTGGGLVGGDTYPYFFPQKQLLSEEFAAGRIPLWHDRTALGYPLLAESQGGIFYPLTQVLYRLLSVHAAWHVSLLLHYWAAYVAAWRYARSQGLRQWSALLAALVFVYGWFPARSSLEWSIIGGVWFPVCLWQTTRLLENPGLRRLSLLAAAFALHLLAGHFALAFITQLTCLAVPVCHVLVVPSLSVAERWRAARTGLGWCSGALLTGLLLASVQLLPTLELRRASQRDGIRSEADRTVAFNPAYGHLPPLYVTQLAASWWYWHSPEVVQSRAMLRTPGACGADTNAVEAHLYLGLLPLGLCLLALNRRIRRQLPGSGWKIWLLLSAAALIYATGWLVPVLGRLPGFGFFMGPGRYSIVSQLGLALLAGLVLDVILRRRSAVLRVGVSAAVAGITMVDLQWSALAVSDAVVIANPPLKSLPDSWLAQTLQSEDRLSPVRVFAPGANIANLCGVSSVPQYLGLGPAAYFRTEFQAAFAMATDAEDYPGTAQAVQLDRLGVTHLLTTEPIARPAVGLQLLRSAPDAFLNRVWGRGVEPCFLYRINGSAGRLQSEPADALQQVRWLQRQPARVEFQVTTTADCVLRLADLSFPGWSVQVLNQDGVLLNAPEAKPVEEDDYHRSVTVPAGIHRVIWTYDSGSFRLGLLLSAGTLAVLLGLLLRESRMRATVNDRS